MISLTEVTSALSTHTINIIYISYYNASVLTQSNKQICKHNITATGEEKTKAKTKQSKKKKTQNSYLER